MTRLQSRLDDVTKPLWQFGGKNSVRNLEQRMILSIQGGNRISDQRDDDESGNSTRYLYGDAFRVHDNGNELNVLQEGANYEHKPRRLTKKIGKNSKTALSERRRISGRNEIKIR